MATFFSSALWSGLTVFVPCMLFVWLIMWAEHRAEAPERQETRKMRTPLR